MIVGRLLIGANEAVGRFVCDQIGDGGTYHSHQTIGVLSKDRSTLIGGVVYHNYDGSNIMADIAATSPRWCSRSTLKAIFDYPFVQLGCRRVTCKVSSGNKRSSRLAERLGFQREGLLREGGIGGEDAIIYGILKSERRY